jgi:hypothetical protein
VTSGSLQGLPPTPILLQSRLTHRGNLLEYCPSFCFCLTRCLLLVSEISYYVANLLLRDVVLCGIMFHCVYHCYLIISAYSFEGILVFSLLVICTCAYMQLFYKIDLLYNYISEN